MLLAFMPTRAEQVSAPPRARLSYRYIVGVAINAYHICPLISTREKGSILFLYFKQQFFGKRAVPVNGLLPVDLKRQNRGKLSIDFVLEFITSTVREKAANHHTSTGLSRNLELI